MQRLTSRIWLIVLLTMLVGGLSISFPSYAASHTDTQLRASVENGTTTLWLRMCGTGNNYRFRTESVTDNYRLLWDQTYGAINGCLAFEYRAVVGANVGEVIRIGSTVMDAPFGSDVDFFRQARWEFCTVTAPGVIDCNRTPNVPTFSGPANGATLTDRTVTFTWSDTGDPDNKPRSYRDYLVQVRRADNTWSQESGWQLPTSWTITLPGDGAYLWRVKSGDGQYGSENWFDWSFTVTPPTPITPTPVTPTPTAPPDSAVHTDTQLRGSLEHGTTTLWLRICGRGNNYRFRVESDGNPPRLLWDQTYGTIEGCLPFEYRAAVGANVGERLNVYTTVMSAPFASDAEFLSKARKDVCTVTQPGVVSCDNTSNPNPTPVPTPAERKIWAIVENNATTILLRECGAGTTHMFRSEKPGAWSERWTRTPSDGCSPALPAGYRVVLGAVPGEQFRISSLLTTSELNEASFLQQANHQLCTITVPGQISCQPTGAPSPGQTTPSGPWPSPQAGVLPVPYADQVFAQQKPANGYWTLCGPASTAMLLSYYGKESRDVFTNRQPTLDLVSEVMINGVQASQASWSGIAGALHARGLDVVQQYNPSVEDIRASITSGHPIIAGVNGTNHILTIIGVKDDGSVVVNDPFGGKFWWRYDVNSPLRNDNPWTPPFGTPRTKGQNVVYAPGEISFLNTVRVTGAAPIAALTVGSGALRPDLFVAAYDRNGGAGAFGAPSNYVHEWGGGSQLKAQDFFNTAQGDRLLTHDEENDQPSGTIPAYETRGGIRGYWLNLGGPLSWLGVPTSDEYVNAAGRPQANFAGGYIDWNNGRPFAVSWPTDSYNRWLVTYRNRVPNGGNEPVGGATWVEQVPGSASGFSLNWSSGAPDDGKTGVWSDFFSVTAERFIVLPRGKYRFTVDGDDGFRLSVNGKLLIDQWAYGQRRTEIRDVEGTTYLALEHFERTGDARIELSWERIGEHDGDVMPLADCSPLKYPVLLVDGRGSYNYNNPNASAGNMTKELEGWVRSLITSDDQTGDASVLDRCVKVVKDLRPDEGNGWLSQENQRKFAANVAELRRISGASKISIIGYSQGGLQARAYIECMQLHVGKDCTTQFNFDVDLLITMGTPHKGAAFGDTLTGAGDLSDPFGKQAAANLAPQALANWNKIHFKPWDVTYAFVAGDNPRVNWLRPPGDGTVNVDSAHGGWRPKRDGGFEIADKSQEEVRVGDQKLILAYTSDCHSDQGWAAVPCSKPATAYFTNRALFDEFISPLLKGWAPSKTDLRAGKVVLQSASTALTFEQPIATGYLDGGEVRSYTLPLDGSASNPRITLLASSPKVILTMRDPQGNPIDAQPSGTIWNYTTLHEPDLGIQGGYAITGIARGAWTLEVRAAETITDAVPFSLQALFETPITLAAQPAKSVVQASEALTVTAQVTAVPAGAKVVARALLRDATLAEVELFDDGQHGDGAAGDGRFGGTVPALSAPGSYQITVELAAGDVQRSVAFGITVSEGQAHLGAISPAVVQVAQSLQAATPDMLTIPVTVMVNAQSQYIIIGELVDARGQTVAYARGGALLEPGSHKIDLVFEGSDLTGYATGRLALRRLQLFEDNGELQEVEELLNITQVSSTLYLPIVTR